VSTQDQLQWEARLARPAAYAAFAAGLLLLAGTVLFQAMLEDREGVEPLPDFLLSVNDSPGTLIAQACMQGAAALCLILVFYYLFRAIVHRGAQIPRWFVYLVILGPAMYAVSQVLAAIDRVDVAETFAEGSPIRGNPGDDRADDLVSDSANGLAIGLSLAGSVSTAFMFVMLPLRARRVGLLSPFMGILGVIVGVLLVLQLVPLVPVVIEAFWLGAVGALFLGRWPGGRGPAWESGEAEPWPTPPGRRGLLTPGGGDAPEQETEPEEPKPAEAEPVPERPSSRKRRRKRG
jgi:hypothetical protein